MSDNLMLLVLFVALSLYGVVFFLFKKGRIPLKYVLVWIIPATIILLVALIPNTLLFLTHFLGFKTIVNMIVGLILVVLIFILISLTVIVSGQKTKITLLIQEVSMLKSKVNNDYNQEDK